MLLPYIIITALSHASPFTPHAGLVCDTVAPLLLDLAAASFGGHLAISGGVTSTSGGSEVVLNDLWSSVDFGGTLVCIDCLLWMFDTGKMRAWSHPFTCIMRLILSPQ